MFHDLLLGALVFVSAALTDVIWVLYIRRTSHGQAVGAAFYGTIIYGLGAYITIEYVKNPWFLAPAAFGGFLGTYFAVKKEAAKAGMKPQRDRVVS